ncbi:hypothetical protein C4K03_4697 [Pseudomonas synxantha]|uniref:Uncharacterized protein n=1 Tax=Pseudomonas synxantha TaxID=47883 RepID=A0A3G7UBV2_9PSED|nr:hypothetical protein [Pseudomonas synxantha]AZE56835.1 hypothetical protein C4K03_4697 [Pseudomonas synxantha]
MPNKQLRIIILDTHLPRLIQTEKSLNRLGYFRILPIQHVDDLRALDHELVTPFDVMFANKGLVCGTETHWRLFRRTTQKIDYVLLYDEKKNVLGDDSIRRLMAKIDPASPWESLKDLIWIKFKKDTRHNCPNRP